MNVGDTMRAALGPPEQTQWLFGHRTDLAAFGGSALVACALLGGALASGVVNEETPTWAWLLLVVCVDVAHVWSTIFRVYLDLAEVKRRALLYVGVPLLTFLGAVLAYGFSALLFWRIVAYTAVFHFVRQQIGWMNLYHRRDGGLSRIDRLLDLATTYAVMIFPLVWWHTRLPRRFAWMIDGDFVPGLAPWAVDLARPVYLVLIAMWLGRFAWRTYATRVVGWGRLLLLSSTALTWYVGIVVFNSDFAFTVMNVIVHGVPYVFLTVRYGQARGRSLGRGALYRLAQVGWPAFFGVVVCLAFLEEVFWDRWVWHDHPTLFGVHGVLNDNWLALVVPLLATPQLTHYVLDGFIWRREPAAQFQS